MPTAYILVGVPGSGKSTWIKNQNWSRHCTVVSTDNYIEAVAKRLGKTYSDVFDDHMKDAIEDMLNVVTAARDSGKDIIWDQTSVSVKTRKKKFNMLPGYKMVAVVFKTPDEAELSRRLSSRPGKHIPESVVKSMIDNFEMPTKEEGFDEIWHAES